MIEAFAKPQRRRTLLYLVICGALASAAGVVGIDDDLPAQSLAWLAAIALVLAFIHPWRTPKRFLLLIGASVLGFVVFAVLSSLMENAGVFGGGVFFLLALFLCPAGLLVGIIGAVGTFAASRREHQQHEPPGSRVA
jgi:membrane associated rhomboid family serine protease